MDKNLVVIGAHIGDCEVMAGGIAAKAVKDGWKVHFIHMTSGEKGHPKLTPEKYLEQKKREALKFGEKIGVQVHFMPYKDGELENTLEVRTRLATLLRKIRPNIIITHWKGSLHKDHIVTYEVVMEAVFYAANPWVDIEGKPVYSRVYYAESWEDRDGFQPEIYIDISEVFKKWIEALKLCAFARGETGFNYIDYYSSLARIRGLEAGFEYAQTLMRPWYARKIRVVNLNSLR